MQHYFSLNLASYFYYGAKEDHHNINAMVMGRKVIPHTKVLNFRSLKLRCKNYFSMPQMLAFDFYMCANLAFPEYKSGKYRTMLVTTLREACRRISDLPLSGWDVAKFKAVMIKPVRTNGFFVTTGTHFDSFGNFSIAKPRKLCYTGRKYLLRLKEIDENEYVYRQVRDNKSYWNVMNRAERAGGRCRAID